MHGVCVTVIVYTYIAGTLPVELPYDDLHVGLRSIVTVIFDRSGSFGLAVFPYYIPPGMEKSQLRFK